MQDLDAITKTVNGLAQAIQTGGVLIIIALALIIGYLLFSAYLKNRKPTQEVNVSVPGAKSSYDAGRSAVWSKQLDNLEANAAAAAFVHADHTSKLASLASCGQSQTDVLGRMDKKLGQLVLMEKLRNGFPKDIDVEEILK